MPQHSAETPSLPFHPIERRSQRAGRTHIVEFSRLCFLPVRESGAAPSRGGRKRGEGKKLLISERLEISNVAKSNHNVALTANSGHNGSPFQRQILACSHFQTATPRKSRPMSLQLLRRSKIYLNSRLFCLRQPFITRVFFVISYLFKFPCKNQSWK